jgi:hypothetical protein
MNAPLQPSVFGAAKTVAAYRFSTPLLMRRGLLAFAVLLLAFWAVASAMVYEAKSGVQTIGRDTAPSVIAAQQIRASLAALDASAVNAALLRGDAAGAAWKDFETQQRILSDYLVTAAQNITFGDSERIPLVEVATNLQVYADRIGAARTAIAAADPRQPALPDATLTLLRDAGAIVSQQLAPAAAALNAANETVLDETWAARKGAAARDTFLLALWGLATLGLLVFAQAVLARRTRRQINLGLVGATLLLAAGLIAIDAKMVLSAQHLRIAKEDAFDSVRAMWKARAVLYSANADESYFLLDPAWKATYAARFATKIGLVAGPRFLDKTPRAAMVDVANRYRRMDCRIDDPLGRLANAGYFGDELNNVTFDHECAEAANLFPLLADYVAIDQKIRALDASGDRAGAIALNLGENPGESNYAFGKVNQELGLLIHINQMAFDDNVAKARADLVPLPYVIGAVALLAWLLAFLGLRPRLAEYRV